MPRPISDTEQYISDLETRYNALVDQNEHGRSEYKKLQGNYNSLATRFNSLYEDYSALVEKFNSFEASYQDLSNELDEEKKYKNYLLRENTELREKSQNVSFENDTRVQEMNSVLEDRAKQVVELEGIRDRLEEEIRNRQAALENMARPSNEYIEGLLKFGPAIDALYDTVNKEMIRVDAYGENS